MKNEYLENGKVNTTFSVKDLNARICRREDFGMSQDYFDKITFLDKLYCLDNYDDAYVINN